MQIDKKYYPTYIRTYNEDELFYRRLYEYEHDTPEALQTFLDSCNKEEIANRKLYVPEFYSDGWSTFLRESSIFQNVAGDIKVVKHNRYSPFFLHQHEFFEILCVYEGSCDMEIQGKPFHFKAGDICIIPPNTLHGVSIFDDSIAINIMEKSSTFRETFFPNFRAGNVLSHFFTHVLYRKTEGNYMIFQTGEDSLIHSILEDLHIEYLGHQKYCESILRNMIMLFWGQLLRRHENHTISFCSANTDANIPEIIEYLTQNYQSITLNSAAEHFGFSVSHFSALLKENTGHTFLQIIKDIKLGQACRALKNTQLSISAICEIVGYDNPEYFMKLFKKEYGMTAGEYRKTNL